MTATVPRSRPQLDKDVARQLAYATIHADRELDSHAIIAACPVIVLAVRGYYRDTIGKPLVNDFGVWDDAAFIVTPSSVTSWNWNTDPAREGWNKGVGKYFAQLTCGVWPFREGPHKGVKNHFRQLTAPEAEQHELGKYFKDERAAGRIKVLRVEPGGAGGTEWGYQAINIHAGSRTGTSSWGCQTCPPEQWPSFQQALYDELARHLQFWLPYVLVEQKATQLG